MPKLFLLPLEPLAERYTSAWYDWLPETFARGFDVTIIDGDSLTDTVETGAFLDLNSTVYYKASQLRKIALLFHNKKVQDGDVFWVSDIEFWGIESIRYMADLQGIFVSMFGFLHAGSYTNEDFMAPMAYLGEFAEPLWVRTFDKVFVGSEYHRQAYLRRRPLSEYEASRIVVTGNPWRTDEARAMPTVEERFKRDIDITFPHRPDREKRPGNFYRLLCEHIRAHKGVPKVAFTTGRSTYRSTNDPEAVAAILDLARIYPEHVSIRTNLLRAGFYAVLRRSRVVVSTAIEENFGYAMVEAMAQGAYPLMPCSYSYPELVQGDDRFLYAHADEFHQKLQGLLAMGDEERETVVQYARTFDNAETLIFEAMQ